MMNTRSRTKKLQICFSQEDFNHQSTTESGALIASNDDLLTEILLRLPVTSILRFKSVCKHWRLLLSHRNFTHRYDKLSKSPGLFARGRYIAFDVQDLSTPPFRNRDSYFYNSDVVENRSTPSRGLEFYFNPSGVCIIQSCNGLLLCCTDRGPKGGKAKLKYYVFNPTTKQLALIPPIPGGSRVAKHIRSLALAFHQTDCVHYKVVFVLDGLDSPGALQIQVYSSATREWKISVKSFTLDSYAPFYDGVYWNGAVHWAPLLCRPPYFYFKIDVEQFQTLPLPEGLMSSNIRIKYFGESRGHLHLIANCPENRLHLNVYEMLSDHSGWFFKYQVQLDELPGIFPEMFSRYGYYLEVINFVRGEEEKDTFMVLLHHTKLITYNVHDKSSKQISSFTRYGNPHPSEVHSYIETLSSF